MKNKNLLTLICVFLLSLTFLNAKALDENLNFEDLYSELPSSWSWHKNNVEFLKDTLQLKGIPILHITKKVKVYKENPFSEKSGFRLFRYLPIRDTTIQNSTVELNLNARNMNYYNSSFIVLGLDDNDEVIFSDSIQIVSDDQWHNYKSIIKIAGINILYIEVMGTDEILNFNEEYLQVSDSSNIWIKAIDIKTHGQSPQDIEAEEKINSEAFCNELKKDLCFFEEFNEMLFPDNTHIIAFGETVHGSETINSFVFDKIREMIEFQDLKLVMLELPIAELLFWNLYINNELDTDIDSLLQEMPMALSPSVVKDFLKWLRSYNLNQTKKVNIFGFDSVLPEYGKYAVAEYIEFLNLNSPLADTLLFNVRFGRYDYAKDFLNKRLPDFKQLLGKEELDLLTLLLRDDYAKQYINQKHLHDRGISFYYNRDYLMWQNVQFALKYYLDNAQSNKVVLCGHLGHLNKKFNYSTPLEPSLGYYVQQAFKEQYYVYAIITGKGRVSTFYRSLDLSQHWSKDELPPPDDLSLEACLLSQKKDVLFFEVKNKKIFPNIRFNSLHFPWRLNHQDSYVFIKESSGFEIPESWPKTKEEESIFYEKLHKYNFDALMELWK